jgi:hypothetical protein
MENPHLNGCSDPAARTSCEVGAKVPVILLRGLGRDFAPDNGGGSLKGPGTHICRLRPERPTGSIRQVLITAAITTRPASWWAANPVISSCASQGSDRGAPNRLY